MKLTLAAAAVLAVGLAGQAQAAVTVMGDTDAQACSDAAFHDRGDHSSL